MPKVSIVLPVYNGEKYLRQSLDSILVQTMTDWELIIVNDCSTDQTAEIAEKYAQADERITVIHNRENRKLPGALNLGFAAARGRYLTWTSDDNLYLPDALQTMSRELDRRREVYMVRASMEYIDGDGRVIGQSEPYDNKKLYSFNCLGACFLYRREVPGLIGGYDESTFCVEDYDYWLRVVENCGDILPIDKILYQYRRHGGSLSELRRKQVNDQLAKLRLRYLDKIFSVLSGNQKELCRIFYNMKNSDNMTDEATERFKCAVPELRGETPYIDQQKYILFGAGEYGERAALMLGSQAAFFADSNTAKAGREKCGLKILSFADAVALAGEYSFMITVSGGAVYEIMAQLQKAGIRQYSVFVGETRLEAVE